MNREKIRQNLLTWASADSRIVGVLDYGSACQRRGDEWSDLDLVIFIRDEAFDELDQNWKTWAAGFGDLLLAYRGGLQHPWAVFDAEPIPTRVDFSFYKASQTDEILNWPIAPISVEAMVLYDDTEGLVSANVAKLIGKSLRPDNESQAFEQVAGDFWYYLLRIYSKIQRGHWWAARFEFTFIVTGNLHGLLRLEAGAVQAWKGSTSANEIESVLSPERLAQLNACIPDQSNSGLIRAIHNAVKLGQEICAALSTRLAWQWPVELSEKLVELYREG